MKQFGNLPSIPGSVMGSLKLWSYSPLPGGSWGVMDGLGFKFEFGETLKKFYNE